MKKYIITEKQIDEVFGLMKAMRMLKVRQILNSLEEHKSQSQDSKPVEAGNNNAAAETSNNSVGNKDLVSEEEEQKKSAQPSHNHKEKESLKI